MSTRQLRHFLALLDTGSLSAAAAAVHLSLPALSRSIRALEESLGVPLFDRNDRRLRPTAYAQAYALRARRMVSEEREAARTLALMQTGDLGTLSMGMGSSLTEPILLPTLVALMRASPGLRLRTMTESSDRLLAALLSEQLDLFVGDVRVALGHPDLAVESLYSCAVSWFCRADHPLAGRRGITSEELRRFPMIAPGYIEPVALRQLGQTYGFSEPVLDHFALITSDRGTVQELLASSDAVSPATDFATLPAFRNGTIVALDVHPQLPLEITFGIVRHAGRTVAPVAERAFALIRSLFAAAEADIAERRDMA